MSMSQEIAQIRSTISGCSLLAFGDVQTRLVLKASHEDGIRRETLNKVANQAASCFAPALLGADMLYHEAIVLSPTEARIYVMGDTSPDFLCFVCSLDINTDHVAELGRQTLAKFAGNDS